MRGEVCHHFFCDTQYQTRYFGGSTDSIGGLYAVLIDVVCFSMGDPGVCLARLSLLLVGYCDLDSSPPLPQGGFNRKNIKAPNGPALINNPDWAKVEIILCIHQRRNESTSDNNAFPRCSQSFFTGDQIDAMRMKLAEDKGRPGSSHSQHRMKLLRENHLGNPAVSNPNPDRAFHTHRTKLFTVCVTTCDCRSGQA